LADGLWDIDESAASVARLYWGTLDRAPDVGRLDYWTGLLNAGTCRAEVALGYTEWGGCQVNILGQIDNRIMLL
jgi:Domain of unknown function (DUF4214)